MTGFQPLGCGLGRPAFPPASPAGTIPEETATMAKKTDSTADQILDVIAKAGGSISGADLRDALPDIADANRRYHAGQLRAQGRISTTGGTSKMTYHLADGDSASEPAERIAKPKAPKRGKATKKPAKAKPPVQQADKKTQPFDQFEFAQRAAVRAAAATPAPIVPPTAHLEDQRATTVAPQFLRRVLALALSRPGDIHDTDRQALAAVAAGC